MMAGEDLMESPAWKYQEVGVKSADCSKFPVRCSFKWNMGQSAAKTGAIEICANIRQHTARNPMRNFLFTFIISPIIYFPPKYLD
jgi:hypothetical protein